MHSGAAPGMHFSESNANSEVYYSQSLAVLSITLLGQSKSVLGDNQKKRGMLSSRRRERLLSGSLEEEKGASEG